jgi:hypothetical protein
MTDVNRKLKSGQAAVNQFTVNQKVILRRILTHNTGLNVHGFEELTKAPHRGRIDCGWYRHHITYKTERVTL